MGRLGFLGAMGRGIHRITNPAEYTLLEYYSTYGVNLAATPHTSMAYHMYSVTGMPTIQNDLIDRWWTRRGLFHWAKAYQLPTTAGGGGGGGAGGTTVPTGGGQGGAPTTAGGGGFNSIVGAINASRYLFNGLWGENYQPYRIQ